MIMKLIAKYKFVFLSLIALVTMFSCRDEIQLPEGYVPDGEDAVVSLKIDTKAFTQITRADMNPELENRVNNLWIGIYNVKSKERTTSLFLDSENVDLPNHAEKTIQDVETKSGRSYIVAVANVIGNGGVDLSAHGEEKELRQLLESADDWDKFRAIAIKQNFGDAAVIQVPVTAVATGIVMTGSYLADDGHEKDPSMPEAVDILPGAGNTLPGKIHLRRLWTQNKINIEPSEDVIDLEVLDIQVVNVPEYSWLQSRDQETNAGKENILGYANAGDAQNPEGIALDNPNYKKSLVYTTTDMDVTNITVAGRQTPRYSFSYWQYENKRTGIIPGNAIGDVAYQEREREYKTVTGNGAGQALNTGIYTSLSPAQGDLNNNATYFRIRANVTYRTPGNLTGENPDGITDLPGSATSRTAICTYTVHLGYLNSDANDFNCVRNSKYTYNIKIRSVKDVLVEAYREGEPQPGAEGVVTDVTNRLEVMDAHSGVFNIYLTTEEISSFSFSMTTYYGGVAKRIAMDKDGNWTRPESGKTGQPVVGDDDFKFYNWIELVPTGVTTPADTEGSPVAEANIPTAITRFPNLEEEPTRSGRVYYLGELRSSGLTSQWFTVYVNEYTYEKRYGEDGWGNEEAQGDAKPEWQNYVMQPQRQAWFNVSQSTSGDNNSSYYKSKYALTQRSIQTYYDYQDYEVETAVGAEHINESLGMNLRWTLSTDGLDPDNGRYNTWIVAGGTAGQRPANITEWPMSLTSIQRVNQITNTNQTGLAGVETGAKRYSVPMLSLITSGLTNNSNDDSQWWQGTATSYDPQISGNNIQYIQAIYACMNRNRDENGNGELDPEELKWYVPTSGKYARLILGRNVLPTPIMNYSRPAVPFFCGDGENTYYHFASSDNGIVWSEEGTSFSNFKGQSNQWSRSPWQVRCIRNLGTDLRSVIGGNRVDMAYDDTDKSTTTYGGMVKTKYYGGAALRTPQTDPLSVHKTNSPLNKLGTYGFEIAPRGNTFSNSAGSHDNEAGLGVTWSGDNNASSLTPGNYDIYKELVEDNTLCSGLNTTSGRTGWRVPNQKEITIMRRMGILNGGNFLTSTQEYYSAIAENGIYPGSDTPGYQYRIASVEDTRTVASFLPKVNRVRCVRDLTAAEAKLTYSQLTANN